MALQSNIHDKPVPHPDFVAWPFIDTLYDYIAFLEKGPIAKLPEHAIGTEVAIVGAGAAGLVAAYELLKIGARPVVFEATDRIGGRACTTHFYDRDGNRSPTDFVEMGSMRFPPSGKVFFHYVNELGLKDEVGGAFPDPGTVPTKLYYENQVLDWPKGQKTPTGGGFDVIARDWGAFMDALINPLYDVWRKYQDAQAADNARLADEYRQRLQGIWQEHITKYKDISFYTAVRQGIESWTSEQMNQFGALGVGSGGFGPLYAINFVEMLRIVGNMWEDNQQLLTCGVSTLMDRFCTQKVTLPGGKKTDMDAKEFVRLESPVTRIDFDGGNPRLHFAKGPPRSYPAVIVAMSTRAMQMIGMSMPTETGQSVVSEPVQNALRKVHIMNSSKLAVRTKSKFWKDDPSIPQNIQTDELPRGVYALDYPGTDRGIVVVSYVWGDDSTKLLALDKVKRLELFKESIRKASPGFAESLVPMNGEQDIFMNDWESTEYQYGAFKLQYPGQDIHLSAAYHQFLSANDPHADTGVYIAGDAVSWSGGWTEGAMHTGLNAACAAAKRIGATLAADSPLSQDPDLYSY